MMTNENAIKWLGNLKNDIGNPHYECLWPYAQAIDEIRELLKEQEAQIEQLEHDLAVTQNNLNYYVNGND